MHHIARKLSALVFLSALSAVGACASEDGPTAPSDNQEPERGTIGLALSADTVEVAQGGMASVTVTLTRPAGFTGGISLNVSNFPAGVGVTTEGTGPNTTAINLSAQATAPLGTSTMTVAAGGLGVNSASASLVVRVVAP